MAIQFRRSALCAGIAALFASAFSAWGADVPQVKVTVNDKQCEPMTLTVNSGGQEKEVQVTLGDDSASQKAKQEQQSQEQSMNGYSLEDLFGGRQR